MGKILLPYLTNARGDLSDIADDIQNAVLDVEEFYGDRLRQPIDVIFTRALHEIAIPEDGIGGRAHSSNFVTIAFTKTSAPSRQLIGEMLCHEVGHAYRWQHEPEWADSFMQKAILEGISICLEAEFAKRSKAKTFFLETMQNRYKDIESCKTLIRNTMDLWGRNCNYNHEACFYTGNHSLPRWAGYSLGYMVVSDALSKSGQNIFDLATWRYSAIEYQFSKMLPR